MPEAAPVAPAPEITPKPEATPEKEIRATRSAVEQVSSTIFNKTVAGKTPEEISQDPVAQEVRSAKKYADITKEGIGERVVLPGHPEHGNDLEEGAKKLDGEEVIFLVDGKKAVMAEIQDVRGKDEIQVGYFEETDTTKDAMKTAAVSRGELHDALLVSERARIEAEFAEPGKFTDSEQAVMKAYLDMVDPKLASDEKPSFDTDLRTHAETAAQENGILTSKDVTGLVEKLFPDADKRPVDVQVFLETLGEEPILSKENFQKTLDIMGLSRDGFRSKADALRTQITAMKEQLAVSPDDDMLKGDLEDAQAALGLLHGVDKLWKAAAEKDETPFDAYFDKVQNGDVDQEKAKAFTEAFRSGKVNDLIDQLPALQETDDMSDEQKAELKSLKDKLKDGETWKTWGKNTGKYGGGAVLAAIILAAVAAAGTVAVAGGAVSALSKGAR